MKLTQKKTTFLMTSIMVFAMIATISTPLAHADFQPSDCTTSSQSLSLTWFRSDKTTTVAGSNSPITNQFSLVDIGEELFVKATLSQTNPDGCNYLNGTLFVTTPDLVDHSLSMNVPLITNVTMFSNFTGSYIVSPSDDDSSCDGTVDGMNNTKLTACGFYGVLPGAPGGAVNGVSHSSFIGEDTAKAGNDAGVNFVIPPGWNATTLANVTGSQSDPVSSPLDVVTIEADSDFLGTFTGNFTLGNATNSFETGVCTGGAVNATTGIATLDCQAIGTYNTPVGDICFDVTVNAPSPYTPNNSTLLGADDSENECFSIIPPGWNATTLANVTGTQSDPVVDPLDVVTVVADNNFLGDFTGNFTLGNSTDVFATGDCTGGSVNATTGNATLYCQVLDTFEDESGEICFYVTINAPSPYTPSQFTLFGADDAENECFELRTEVPFNATTLSNVTGIVGPTINPSDQIIINGINGTFGNFTGNATLTFNSTVAVATTSCSSVSGDEYALYLECDVEDEFVDPGQYCWDVTVTETSGNYTPSVLNLFGIDDAENECFSVFEGLTPGFWKNNAESWDAGAWYIQNTTDSFHDVFNVTGYVELKLAKGKLKNDDLDRGSSTNSTLYGALGARGGDENALARHCVAAKLNVENPDVTYPLNYTEVISQCEEALQSGDVSIINDLKDLLDGWNNFGADISQNWPN